MIAGRILVVEDETKTAAVLKLYLEKAGFEVSLAQTGAEALKEARRRRFDLVLLDLMLPEVDGLAVCRAIRSESDVPVVIVTARVAEAEKLEGLRIGADDYVTKPFSPREVVARVRAVLRRANPVRPRGFRIHDGPTVRRLAPPAAGGPCRSPSRLGRRSPRT